MLGGSAEKIRTWGGESREFSIPPPCRISNGIAAIRLILLCKTKGFFYYMFWALTSLENVLVTLI